jgi:N6-adenosine-specific RNA methylase IME4
MNKSVFEMIELAARRARYLGVARASSVDTAARLISHMFDVNEGDVEDAISSFVTADKPVKYVLCYTGNTADRGAKMLCKTHKHGTRRTEIYLPELPSSANYSLQLEVRMRRADLFDEPAFVKKSDGRPVTGYTIYNAEQQRRTIRNDLPALYPDLPEKKYSIIYADPPWDYGGKMQFDKSSVAADKMNWERRIFISSANFKYPTLKTGQMKAIPLKEIASADCLLFMWVTNPHLAQGIELGHAWGFEYKTVAFIWDKMVHNPGKYTLSYCEMCLVFKRGRIPSPRGTRNEKQLIRSPRGEHSVKPEEVRQAIERMFPSQSKIELFARHKPKGWDVWGLDVREVY